MSATKSRNSFGARAPLQTRHAASLQGDYYLYRLDHLAKSGLAPNLDRLPFSIKIMLEAVLRNCDGYLVREDDVRHLATWSPSPAPAGEGRGGGELPFLPARVVMQDFTGVPCVVDLAAMRDAVKRLGGDPKKINPLVPVDLVIDHSVQVDYFGTELALLRNAQLEFERNRERYEFPGGARRRSTICASSRPPPASCIRSISSFSRRACSANRKMTPLRGAQAAGVCCSPTRSSARTRIPR